MLYCNHLRRELPFSGRLPLDEKRFFNQYNMSAVLPLISVVVPVYNAEQYLRCCLDSIRNQTYRNLEIICVDDGSVDASGSILDEYAAADERFVVIHQQNAGQAVARNVALAIAKGEWIANVDSDDYLEVSAYEQVAKHFEDDIDMVWIGNHIVCDFDEKLKQAQERFYALKYEGAQTLDNVPLASMSGAVWNKIIRRSLLEQYEIRYPKGVIFEDLCYFAQVAPILRKVYFLPEKLYYYLQRENSTMGVARTGESDKSRDVLKIIKPMYEFYAKHGFLKTHSRLYDAFFTKFYSLANKFLPDDMKPELVKEAGALVRNYGGRDETARAGLLDMMMSRVYGPDRIRAKRLLGIRVYYEKRTWNSMVCRFMGIKLKERKVTPDYVVEKTLFRKKQPGRKEYRFFGIPYFTVIEKDGVQKKKLFGVTVKRKKLQADGGKAAAGKPVITAAISYLSPCERLAGKKIIITGGGRGLGFSMAQKFVAEGAEVLIAGRNAEMLAEKAAELGCKYLPLDVQDVSSFAEFIQRAEELLGGVNCLVNNAGISMHETNIRTVTVEGFDAQINTNLRGGYFLAQEFIKLTEGKKRRDCGILFISSERGFFVDDIPYGLTKVAVNSLVQGLAVRMLPSGIRVNGLAPGITSSDMTGFKADGNLFCGYNANKRVYLPEEVAETACFLLSDASRCITGQIIACDEGRAINPHWRRS